MENKNSLKNIISITVNDFIANLFFAFFAATLFLFGLGFVISLYYWENRVDGVDFSILFKFIAKHWKKFFMYSLVAVLSFAILAIDVIFICALESFLLLVPSFFAFGIIIYGISLREYIYLKTSNKCTLKEAIVLASFNMHLTVLYLLLFIVHIWLIFYFLPILLFTNIYIMGLYFLLLRKGFNKVVNNDILTYEINELGVQYEYSQAENI